MPPRKQETTQVYLSLKHGHTTTFLISTLITPFSTIISDLLSGLSARYSDGIPSGPSEDSPKLRIPIHPRQVRIAKLHDNTNSDKGWSEIPWLKYENDKLKNCSRAWDVAGGAKLAFAFTKNEAEVDKMRDLSDEEEEDMVKAEAPEFWVEWPNFEWMDEQAAKEEEDDGEVAETERCGEEDGEVAKRERCGQEDGETLVREKRRRVVDDDDE